MFDRFETFATTIATINRYVQKIKSMEMKTLGLKGTHVMCLYSLGKHPEGLTATQLCRLCGEDKAAVSRTLAELSERGLVEKPEGYRAPVTLTEAGKAAAVRVDSLAQRAVGRGGDGLSDAERENFYRAMGVIGANLMRMCGEDGGR